MNERLPGDLSDATLRYLKLGYCVRQVGNQMVRYVEVGTLLQRSAASSYGQRQQRNSRSCSEASGQRSGCCSVGVSAQKRDLPQAQPNETPRKRIAPFFSSP